MIVNRKQFNTLDGALSCDASDLEIPVGKYPIEIYVFSDRLCIGDREKFSFISRGIDREGEVQCWKYRAINGDKLTIFND